MGMADAIVDLVSSGTTLRENNLKEIDGGVVLESQVNFLSHTHMHVSGTHSSVGNISQLTVPLSKRKVYPFLIS
jgi:ATP phosphoribosyltransferase